MLRTPWTVKKTNKEVMERAGQIRLLVKRLEDHRLPSSIYIHITRREGLEHLIITGKLEGGQGRGRMREQMIDSLAAWVNRNFKKHSICNFCVQGLRSLERHGHQHLEAGQLIIIIIE